MSRTPPKSRQSPATHILGTAKSSSKTGSSNVSVLTTSTGLGSSSSNLGSSHSKSNISLSTITSDKAVSRPIGNKNGTQTPEMIGQKTISAHHGETPTHKAFSATTLRDLHLTPTDNDILNSVSPSSSEGTSNALTPSTRPHLVQRQSSHHKLADIAHKFGELLGGHKSSSSSTSTSAIASPLGSPSVSRSGSSISLNKVMLDHHHQPHHSHSNLNPAGPSPSHTSTFSSLRAHLPSLKSNTSISNSMSTALANSNNNGNANSDIKRNSSSKEGFFMSGKSKKSTTSMFNLRNSESSASSTSGTHSSNSSNSVNMGTTSGSSTSQLASQLDSLLMKPSASKVKETHYVHVEYDPISRRRVLNTYEILNDLGSGQHGKVKLAKDIHSNELVAIKIVDRKSKPKLGRFTKPGSSQEDKIRREIAIMKKCDHENVVKLIEVLDAENSRKIYLVLEYMEKGEIKWQHRDEDTNYEAEPVLTFFQAKKIFRDVVSGLEYLHHQGIIHRDIKPSNLLVSKDLIVKISDFGVSFADSLDGNDEFELAKTAGTPAFLAPELCQTAGDGAKVTYKIDIWALGVTLFCLAFGNLPFNGDSEFLLFDAINTKEPTFPDMNTWKTARMIADADFKEIKDILYRLLEKDPEKRADIIEIKSHPFFQSGLSRTESKRYTSNWRNDMKIDVTNKEVDEAVIGIGSRIKKKINNVLHATGLSAHGLSSSSSGTSSSNATSRPISGQNLQLPAGSEDIFSHLATSNHSYILSESLKSQSSINKDFTSDSHSHLSHRSSLRHKSISHSLDSSTSNSSITASLINAEGSVRKSSVSGIRSSALNHLSEIIEKDQDNRRESDEDVGSIDSTEINELDVPQEVFTMANPMSEEDPSVSTITPMTKNVFEEVPPAAVDIIQANSIDVPNFSEINNTYDFRDELNRSDNKVSLPVAHSFASLDSFYDDSLMNNPVANPYAQNQRFSTHGNGDETTGFPRYQYQPPSVRQISNRISTINTGFGGITAPRINSNSGSSRTSPIHSAAQSGVSITDHGSKRAYNQPISSTISNSYYNRSQQYSSQQPKQSFRSSSRIPKSPGVDDNDDSDSDADSYPLTFSRPRRLSNKVLNDDINGMGKIRPTSIYGRKINTLNRTPSDSSVIPKNTHALLKNDSDSDDDSDEDELMLSFGGKHKVGNRELTPVAPVPAARSNTEDLLIEAEVEAVEAVEAFEPLVGNTSSVTPRPELKASNSTSELHDVPLNLQMSHVDPDDTEVAKLLPEMMDLKVTDSSAAAISHPIPSTTATNATTATPTGITITAATNTVNTLSK